MEQISQQIEFDLPVSFITEGNQVVAYTPALDISTSGKDEAESKKRFGELVGIFFADLLENGTMETVLSDLGWKKNKSVWNPPVISQTSISVRVPIAA
jgi:hypothetical protein